MYNPHYSLRRYYVAVILSVIAFFSYIVSLDHTRASRFDLATIPTAIASAERIGNNLSMFLKIDGVQGGSTDSRHRGEILVDSYSWGMTKPLGSKTPTMQTFTVTLPSGVASPELLLRTAGSVKSQKITLSVREGTGPDSLVWILTDVTPVSFQTVGNTRGDGAQDALTFAFSRIEVMHTSNTGETIRKGWDQRSQKGVIN